MDLRELEGIARRLLVAIGEDPERPGLQGTPARFARHWQEFIEYRDGNTGTAFEVVTADQLVAVKDIRVWSLCEHHLLPFWVDVSVGYIPRTRVLGLSKFARIAQLAAHRLQLQERLIQQIADEVARLADTEDVAVYGVGEHTCMAMRGIRSTGVMCSSVMRGAFRTEHEARAEFFNLLRA
jgi:GTP cyclohydrolase I